jgi:plastocyanin
MRRPLLAIALLAVALASGACSGSAGPGWTYAAPTPAPAVTPAPSGAASAAPAGQTPVPTDAAPSAGAAASAGTSPSAGPAGGTTVDISASNMAYEQTEISVPADTAFVIRFDNKEAGTMHNVEIRDASGMLMFKGDVITGPAQAQYQVPALPAGTYQFICTVHPIMVGTLKVGG